MPIYEYQCSACGHTLEVMQKMSDDPLKACPNCQQLELTKLVSASGFRLKGSGWYETDFKKGGQKSEAPAPACAAACGSGGCAAAASE